MLTALAVVARIKVPLALFSKVSFLKLALSYCPFIVPGALLGNFHKLNPLNVRGRDPLVLRVVWLLQGDTSVLLLFTSTFAREETYAQYTHLQTLAAR